MADSCKPGPSSPPVGICKIPARTPGPLGYSDHGDPSMTSLLGDTPGSLGVFDWAMPDQNFSQSLYFSEQVCKIAEGNLLALAQDDEAKPSAAAATTDTNQKTKSGKYWVDWSNKHAKNSRDIEALEAAFKGNVKQFLKALTDAGATYKITTTKRSKERAYLFHWSWKISQGKCKASDASTMQGVDIDWDHGDEQKSKEAALEMVDGFGLAVPPKSTVAPSLTSNHIAGKAIDMTITWTKDIKIKKKDNTEVTVTYTKDVNSNTTLHEVGKSYGVIKHTSDAPHWSVNGR